MRSDRLLSSMHQVTVTQRSVLDDTSACVCVDLTRSSSRARTGRIGSTAPSRHPDREEKSRCLMIPCRWLLCRCSGMSYQMDFEDRSKICSDDMVGD